MSISRQNLSNDTLIQAFKLNGRCWKIRFIGESVDDCGGGYSDSIAEICQEMQCPEMALPLLVCTPNTAEHEETSREFVLKPVTSETTQCERQLYVFLGLLIGSAIRQGSPLSLRMDKSMWKLLRGESLTLNDLFAMDQSFKQKIEFVRNNLEEIDVDGTIRRVSGETVTIVDGSVTEANKEEYLSKAIEFKLNEFNSAILIVRENIIKVIQLPLLSMFTPDELNTLITGEVDIPIDLLKKVTVYKGITADSDYASWFWEILQDFTCKERQVSRFENSLKVILIQLFLRFVWGRTRLPRTVADFRGRDFVLQVMDKYKPPNQYLPEAYTCFFLLKMPRYTTKAFLKEKLTYAIHVCKSIDIDDYAHVNLNVEDRTQNMELIDEHEVFMLDQF